MPNWTRIFHSIWCLVYTDITHAHAHTDTHNRFMTLLHFVWDYQGEQAP